MKVAIAGAGNVGTFIAADLQAAGHSVLLIEQDEDLVARLAPTLDVQWFVGDACEVVSLQEAGLAEADVVVAARAPASLAPASSRWSRSNPNPCTVFPLQRLGR